MVEGEKLVVLGIETSCDETAAGVVERAADGRGRILADVVFSQIEEHAAFGGVVPEIAARAHVNVLDGVIGEAMKRAGCDFADLDGVAATAGPGLIGGLIVGLTTGKAIALGAGRRFVAVNHLEGHALTARLSEGIDFPYLLLLVSGGHTEFVAVRGVGRYRRLGATLDDALGEAFDKIAKMLDLGYPGGPAVELAATGGDASRFDLPRPLAERDSLDFSFSGLKTAARLAAEAAAPLGARDIADICAGFQAAAADVLAVKTERAMRVFAREFAGRERVKLVIAGGVAANAVLRGRLGEVADAAGADLFAPPPRLCTDNGAMIAWAGAERLARRLDDSLGVPPCARWPLDEVIGEPEDGSAS